MKLAVALTLVIAFPAVAAAQYGLQLRPSPYRVMSGWEQSANTFRTQSVEGAARAVAPARNRPSAGQARGHLKGINSDITGSTPAPR